MANRWRTKVRVDKSTGKINVFAEERSGPFGMFRTYATEGESWHDYAWAKLGWDTLPDTREELEQAIIDCNGWCRRKTEELKEAEKKAWQVKKSSKKISRGVRRRRG